MEQTDTLQLRPATMDDARLLFDWVNAPDSLASKAATTSPIDWSTHRAWLAARIGDSDCLLEIIEVEGRPAGQVRLEPGRRGHLVDIYVSAAHRRSGLARAALGGALERCSARPVVALVKSDNSASQALFRSLGFRETGSDGALMIFERKD